MTRTLHIDHSTAGRLGRARQTGRCGRLLFVHDSSFQRGENGAVWTNGPMPASFWSRYLGRFDLVEVAGRQAPSDMQRLVRSDSPDVQFHLFPNLSGLRQGLVRPQVRRDLAKLVRDSDAVVARLPSELGLMACGLAHRYRKPLLVEVVGCVWDALRMHGAAAGKVYAPLAYVRTRQAVSRAQFVTYVTQRWLQKRYPSRVPGLDAEWNGADRGLQAGICDAEFDVPTPDILEKRRRRIAEVRAGRPPVFGTIGALTVRYKGFHVALDAMAKLAEDGREFSYRILGLGDPASWIELIAAKGLQDICVIDPPREPGADVIAWLDGIDIYIQPSLTEALGRGTIEAMSRGVPSIGSATGGLKEYLNPRFLHPPGDSRALADHLRQVMDDAALLEGLSEEALATVGRFSPKVAGERRDRMLGALAEVVPGRGNCR